MVQPCCCKWHYFIHFYGWVVLYCWRRKWQPTPVLLPGKFHGSRSLVGYSPWGHKESDTIERLHFHFQYCCMYIPHLDPFICWWTFRLIPCLDYCKPCCCEHKGACIFLIIVLSGCMPRSGIDGSYGNSILSFSGTALLHQFTFPPAV